VKTLFILHADEALFDIDQQGLFKQGVLTEDASLYSPDALFDTG